MARLFGFGSYTKPGKGVSKTEKEKKRFFQFFDLYFRKFGKLVQLNLLFILFCLPIFTIGPAIAAMMKILRYYNEGKPVFLFSDFWDAFKENFFQSFIVTLLLGVMGFAAFEGIVFYSAKLQFGQWLYVVPLVLVIALFIILVVSSFYIYLLIVTVDLKLFALIKNAIMFVFVGLITNVCTLFFVGIFVTAIVLVSPLSLVVVALIGFSTIGIIVAFNSFQYIYSYLVKPYYEQNGLPNPYEPEEKDEEDPVFEDTI